MPEDSIIDFGTEVFGKPCSQFIETFGKERKESMSVLSKTIRIDNTDAGINPGFVDIKATTDFMKNFEHIVPPVEIVARLAGTGHPAKSSQLRKR